VTLSLLDIFCMGAR